MIAWVPVLLAAALLAWPGAGCSLRRLARAAEPDVDAIVAAPHDPLAFAGSFDLLAACLRAGLPMANAAAAVAESAPAALADALRRAADLLALGAEPPVAWAQAATDPATESLARMARRSARSGAALAGAIADFAERERSNAEDAAVASAERAGVLIGGPLGLCFLPAFVCLGIVPVVVGLATRVMNGGVL